MKDRRFRNRLEAGQMLAEALSDYEGDPSAIVLGLPKGGVITASAFSSALRLPLDVFISVEIRAPNESDDFPLGAITETGETYIDECALCCQVWLPSELRAFMEFQIESERKEMARLQKVYRGGGPMPALAGKTVLLVSDGISNGCTSFAAVNALRRLKVARIVGAIPVAESETIRQMHYVLDDAAVLMRPDNFTAIRDYYENFAEVSDEEAARVLARARKPDAWIGDLTA